jgi:1-acyl-sn-glycerol-3-phosphate acyltransferase
MFRAIFSIILWPIGAIIFLIGTIVYSVSIVFFSPNKLHPLARVLARIFMLFGGQWFRVKGIAPDPKNGPYLYMINHASLFDAMMVVASIPHYFTGVG